MTSNRTRSRILLGSALLILTFITYSRGIGIRPLRADERAIEEQGLVLAELGGHDADGRRLPLFVRAGEILWLQPLPVYATAALVNLIPSAVHARWTAISFGAAGVLLLSPGSRLLP